MKTLVSRAAGARGRAGLRLEGPDDSQRVSRHLGALPGRGDAARDLCQHVSGIDPNAAYLAGLFHDIGKPVVAALLLEVERGTSQKSASPFLSGGVWRRVVEECHREVGAIIAYRWYLPQEVAQAIAQLDTYDLKRGRSTANVVRLSNGLCQREGLDVKARRHRDGDARDSAGPAGAAREERTRGLLESSRTRRRGLDPGVRPQHGSALTTRALTRCAMT
jgi:putative nucleotidyltransferase with HDIG domain